MPINSFSPPRIVIDTNSPVHAESSPHVRRTLDINRESDIHAVAGTPQTPISIHALRKESDPGTLRLTKRSKNFNPHSPCGERPCWNIRPNAGSYFNPHSPCEERLKPDLSVLKDMQFQSTLPLRGATSEAVRYELAKLISIHTPLAGSDSANTPPKPEKDTFQSTLPLRGATRVTSGQTPEHQFQSTLPLRGATYSYWISPSVQIFQSTLPLRGATTSTPKFTLRVIFQSTLPLRGVTVHHVGWREP